MPFRRSIEKMVTHRSKNILPIREKVVVIGSPAGAKKFTIP